MKLNQSGEHMFINPGFDPAVAYAQPQLDILNDEAFEQAKQTITGWPGYAPSPLHSLTDYAGEFNVSAVYYQDEGGRFGLGSFKALGGAYAVARQLARNIAEKTGDAVATADVGQQQFASINKSVTVCCATDGNHGRSVAWGAQNFGCSCVIFIHATVSEARKTAIEAFGAKVVRVQGNYDDSVAEAQRVADEEGWIVVSDTSYPGYTEIPKDVMQGYELMVAEALESLDQAPTHVFVQTGVGGMAAAVAAHLIRKLPERPRIILADPSQAACWHRSLTAGEPVAVGGDLDTIMAGLACGEVSLLAWTILKHTVSAVVVIEDDKAIDCMRRLAKPKNDPVIVAGESAVGGLAAFAAVAAHEQAREALEINADSTILVFGTENDTDEELYQKLVGVSGQELRQQGS